MKIRVASVTFQQRILTKFSDFAAAITQHVRFAADCGAQLIVFPEYITSSLQTINADWDSWTQPYLECLLQLAKNYKIFIQGGTHVTCEDGQRFFNTALLVSPSGNVAKQHKIHLTPHEKTLTSLQAGNQLQIFQTELAKLAILICYDIEFPQLAHAAVQAGAELLLVPSYTDDISGYFRVNLCTRTRCIETQVYTVQAPLVGNLSSVRYFEQTYGKAGIYSPCDIPFPMGGILAEGPLNQDYCVVGELDLDTLRKIRENGMVTPLRDAIPQGSYTIQQQEIY